MRVYGVIGWKNASQILFRSRRTEWNDFRGQLYLASADGGPLVAIVDFGLKANIVRSLRRRGLRVRILPHTATAADVLAALFALIAQRIAAIPSAQTRNLILNSLEGELRCSVAAVLVEMHNGRK